MAIIRANKCIVALVLTGAVALGTSGIVYAQGLGSTPKGKPFVEINGQIVEVQGDISDLQAQHEAILARVEALEDADFQGQIDLLNSEIARLDLENDQRVIEIGDLIDITTQNGFDVAFALSEIQRLEDEIDSLAADQTALIADFQSQIDALTADIALNASGLLSAIEDVEQNFDLIGLLQLDLDIIESDVAALAAELAGKQNAVGADCPTGFFVFGVRDDGTLDCAQDSASATPTFITSSSGNVDLDNTSSSAITHDHCHLFVVVCLVQHTITTTTFFPGDRFVSVFCPSGYNMTGGGFGTGIQNDIVIEDSRPFGNGWTVFFDNRNSGDTSGRFGFTRVRCVLHT